MRLLSTEFFQNQDGRFVVLSNLALAGHLRRGDRWEPHLTEIISHILPKGGRAIDAGAHIGYTTVIMANCVGADGAVIAFEPLRIIYQLLCTNVNLNGLPNVFTVHGGLGAEDGEMISTAPVDYFSEGSLLDSQPGAGGERVRLRTIDAIGVEGITLIKIDAQGYEQQVLSGAEKTIRSDRPVLLIEIEDFKLRRHGGTAEGLLSQLQLLGYHLLWLDNDYPAGFVAVPVERKEQREQLLKLPLPLKNVAGVTPEFLSLFERTFIEKTARSPNS